jgi:putative nucleotidyltransferase with HDIG domain
MDNPNNSIIMISSNEEVSKYFMEQLIIEAGYSVSIETSLAAAAENLKQNSYSLIIADFDMPDFDSIKLIKGLRSVDPDCIIVAYTRNQNADLLNEVNSLGVYEVITKPINLDRLLFVTRKAIELHAILVAHRRLSSILKEQNMSIQRQNLLLAKRIEESTRNLARLYEDLRSTYLRTIKALAQAIDARDHYTHSHSVNVAKYAVDLSREMGLSLKEIEAIREASELHDLGKIGISDTILTKPSSLNQEEWGAIKLHPQTGAQILEPLTFLSDVIELVRQHHEHYDGRGYPAGLKGEEILSGARIIHLADAYDSMISARSYRKTPLSKQEAIAEIERNSGTQFDPKVVEVFLKIVNEL